MARRATKIVATLGPASSDPQLLEAMIRAGVNVVRLNFSHGKAQDHIDRATLVRQIAAKVGKPIALMADLQGPKIRVGKFAAGKTLLVPGTSFVLDAARTELGDDHAVGLDYKELPRDVKPGDTLLLNDGLLVLMVDAVRGEQVHTTVKIGGELSNNKGINKQGGGLTAPALTAKDMDDIKTAMAFQCDYLAVSFPKNATDMEMARQLANVAGEHYRHKPAMIAKIERSEAIPLLESILKASDGIMVARGDLAVEVGNAAVPALQKRMIRLAREMDKIAITATQMMESMILAPVPTRAEVSDVANAVLEAGGRVQGVIPQALADREVARQERAGQLGRPGGGTAIPGSQPPGLCAGLRGLDPEGALPERPVHPQRRRLRQGAHLVQAVLQPARQEAGVPRPGRGRLRAARHPPVHAAEDRGLRNRAPVRSGRALPATATRSSS